MKKILFISTFWGVLFLATLICSAATKDPIEFDLGTITNNFSWSTPEDNSYYRLSFTVNTSNGEGVNLTINTNKSIAIWFFNATDQTWSSDTGSWEKEFANGSYTIDIYGQTSSFKMATRGSTASTVPIPGALLLFSSGIFGLFLAGRSKQLTIYMK